MMRDGNHDDELRLNGIDDAEGESPNEDAPKPVPKVDAQLRAVPHGVDLEPDVVEKIATEVWVCNLVEERPTV